MYIYGVRIYKIKCTNIQQCNSGRQMYIENCSRSVSAAGAAMATNKKKQRKKNRRKQI